jgi:ubiquinone/menaquinone biosynthesis C-methylase UbiE
VGFYNEQIAPRLCHLAMGNARLRPYRDRATRDAAGRVLEVGAGSGLNFARYGTGVREIIALEPSRVLLRMARQEAARTKAPVSFLDASGEAIPLDAASIDTVVLTWTLCSIPDPVKALTEMQRVLKPDGRLVFVEHGLSPDAGVRKWQDRLTPVWKRLGGGCHLNRPMKRLIEGAGFRMDRLTMSYAQGPKFATYFYEGAARQG